MIRAPILSAIAFYTGLALLAPGILVLWIAGSILLAVAFSAYMSSRRRRQADALHMLRIRHSGSRGVLPARQAGAGVFLPASAPATHFTGPRPLAGSDDNPSIPSPDAGGAKIEGCATPRKPGRACRDFQYTQSGHVVTNSDEAA